MTFILSRFRLSNATSSLKTTYCLTSLGRSSAGVRNMTSEADKSEKAVHEKGKDTVFDKIIARKIPADIIYEDEYTLAFNDINPQAPTHFLVVPKKHIPTLDDATDDDKEILARILLTAKTIAKTRLPKGYRLIINCGRDGCQSVFHLHAHVLGGRKLHWPPG